MKTAICPSILAADFGHLEHELDRIQGADCIHIDIMDGHFVPNISFGPMIAAVVNQVCGLPLDVHLMVTDPSLVLDQLQKLRPAYITVHQEACLHLQRMLAEIRLGGSMAGVALNPATPVSTLRHILPDIDLVLIMTVNPGFGGQQFIPHMVDKIRELKELIADRDIRIQVDGGITTETIAQVTEAGADMIVSGSAIFQAPDANAYIKLLRQNCSR